MLKWWKRKKKEEINMGNNKHNFVVGDWVYTPIKPCKSIHTIPQEIEDMQGKYAKICGEWFDLDKLKFAFNNGDEVEVSDDGIQWNKALFVGVNPKITNYRYVVVTERNFSTSSWINIRPVQPKPTTIEWMGQELSIESAKAMVEGINKKLEEL